VTAPDGGPYRLEPVWDPLLDALEAVPCPECGRPTFAFDVSRPKGLVCPACKARLAAEPVRKGRR
jgi:hypothetical protein